MKFYGHPTQQIEELNEDELGIEMSSYGLFIILFFFDLFQRLLQIHKGKNELNLQLVAAETTSALILSRVVPMMIENVINCHNFSYSLGILFIEFFS